MKKERVINERLEPQEERSHVENSPSGYLNVQNIANYLGIRTSTLYSMVEKKRVPHYRIGRQIRFKKTEIDAWMAGQREAAVDVKMEATKVIRSLQKKPDLEVDRIVKKVVEDTKKKGYNFPQEKPGGIEGLETEVNHGLI
jgi:excisionase family DNA binding protein